MKQFSNRSSGFTLIELLITVAVLGILAGGILIALNIGGVLGKANLTKAKQFSTSLERGLALSQVGKWSFEDLSNPTKDTSGYGNTASMQGAPTPTSSCEDLDLGQCLPLDGSTQYMVIDSSNSLDELTSQLTISVWVRAETLDDAFRPIIVRDIFPNQRWYIENDRFNPGKILFNVNIVGVAGTTSDTTLELNRWYHIVMTYDGSEEKLYINGKLDKENPKTGTISTTGDIGIGSDPSGNGGKWDGLIDEVSIYKEALTLSQIEHLYAQGAIKRYLGFK